MLLPHPCIYKSSLLVIVPILWNLLSVWYMEHWKTDYNLNTFWMFWVLGLLVSHGLAGILTLGDRGNGISHLRLYQDTTLCYTALHCATLCYTALTYTTLHRTNLHYTTQLQPSPGHLLLRIPLISTPHHSLPIQGQLDLHVLLPLSPLGALLSPISHL